VLWFAAPVHSIYDMQARILLNGYSLSPQPSLIHQSTLHRAHTTHSTTASEPPLPSPTADKSPASEPSGIFHTGVFSRRYTPSLNFRAASPASVLPSGLVCGAPIPETTDEFDSVDPDSKTWIVRRSLAADVVVCIAFGKGVDGLGTEARRMCMLVCRLL